MNWLYSETEIEKLRTADPLLYTQEGGQLIDEGENCLTTDQDTGLIRVDACVTIPDNFELLGDIEKEEIALALEQQLWSLEEAETGSGKYYLRAICTDSVVKKIATQETKNHNEFVYSEQHHCKHVKHFDAQLVDLSECVDNKYNINHCLWSFKLAQ